jgi:hypothetical protein
MKAMVKKTFEHAPKFTIQDSKPFGGSRVETSVKYDTTKHYKNEHT